MQIYDYINVKLHKITHYKSIKVKYLLSFTSFSKQIVSCHNEVPGQWKKKSSFKKHASEL